MSKRKKAQKNRRENRKLREHLSVNAKVRRSEIAQKHACEAAEKRETDGTHGRD